MGESTGQKSRPWALWPPGPGGQARGQGRQQPTQHRHMGQWPSTERGAQTARDTTGVMTVISETREGVRVCVQGQPPRGAEGQQGREVRGRPSPEPWRDSLRPPGPYEARSLPQGHDLPAPSPRPGARAEHKAWPRCRTDVTAEGVGGPSCPSNNELHSLSATCRTSAGSGAIPSPLR